MEKRENSRGPFIIVLIFLVSRILFFLAGVRFDHSPLYSAIQVIDPILLKTRLFESLFFLPSQPPLFNLFLGIVLKIFPESYPVVFQGLFLLTGLIFFLTLYSLMVRLQINTTIALILTSLFMINPAVILYENWLLYTYLLAAGLTLAAFFLHRYFRQERFVDCFFFFVILSALALTTSVLHFVWFLGWVLIIALHRKKKARQILIASGAPFLILFLVYAKNLYLFGSFTLSKVWLGDQLLNIAFKDLSDEEVKEMYEQKKISLFSTTSRWSDKEIEQYGLMEKFQDRIDQVPMTGIPILDQVKKPTTGNVSWHSGAYLMIAENQIKDSLYVLSHYPQNYLNTIKRNYLVYFFPGPTDVTFPNRKYIVPYENAYNFMFMHLNNINDKALYDKHLLLWYEFDRLKWDALSIILFGCVVCFYVFILAFGLFWLVHSYRGVHTDVAFNVTMLFIILTIIYVTVVTNAFAWFGTNRYRFILDSFYLILTAFALTYMIESWKARRKVSSIQNKGEGHA